MRAAWGTLAVAAALVPSAPALAQDDSVHINPNSPSGVEYDLPLERARRDAAGSPSSAPIVRGEQNAKPFGQGITATAARASGAASGSSKHGSRSERSRSNRAGKIPPEVVEAAARPLSTPGSDGSALLYGALGALVIGSGALIGLAARRRGR